MLQLKSQSGLAALLVVVIIGAATLLMAKSVSLLGLDEIDMAYTDAKGEEALAVAEGCTEETLRRFQLDENYTADNYVLPLGSGECVINTAVEGSRRLIDIVSRADNCYKRIKADITIASGTIILNSREEY